MGLQLAGGNVAIDLLANAMATGSILVVLTNFLSTVSGANFNPAVGIIFIFSGKISHFENFYFAVAPICSSIIGAGMGDWQFFNRARS